MTELKTNVFYHGDCLFVMKHDIPAESVDLIYLDPPFYNTGVQRPGVKYPEKWNPGLMEISYEDSKNFWGSSEKVKKMRNEAPEWLIHIAQKQPQLASYLYYMMERLQECRRVLKSTGSIYLHCDWRASHYLKMIMDEIFGSNNFQDEIVWYYAGTTRETKRFARKHDIILFYSKSQNFYFDVDSVRIPYKDTTGIKKDLEGRFYINWTKDKVYYPPQRDGKLLGKTRHDVWIDIPSMSTAHPKREYTGYPTQKTEKLLKQIILASSKEEDIIFDPFCGCGTTIVVAHDLNRKWIGIDINNAATEVIVDRCSQLKIDNPFKPITVERIIDLVLKLSPNKFEKWVNEFYNAEKPSPDKGVDGITFDGIPIQTKTWKAGYEVVSRLLTDAEFHPNVPKPIKKICVVSQTGFDDSARKLAFEIETKKGIEVELFTPGDMLGVIENV